VVPAALAGRSPARAARPAVFAPVQRRLAATAGPCRKLPSGAVMLAIGIVLPVRPGAVR
jgi:hypothetical protein